MIKPGAKLIGQGYSGKVYSNGDGTVTKVVVTDNLHEMLPGLPGSPLPVLKGVAKTFSVYHIVDKGINTFYIIKEEVENLKSVCKAVERLDDMWDDALIHSDYLFDFLSKYLNSSNKKPLTELRAINDFSKNILITSPNLISTWNDLLEIIQELKDNGVYSVDFNPENFGMKDGKLIMFELGEAMYKILK